MDLFLGECERVGRLPQAGQVELRWLLGAYLRRLERDPQGNPIRLYPFTREAVEVEDAPCLVVIDPQVGFGNPCLAGTGAPTSVIAERFLAGDSVAALARDYGRPVTEIGEAIRFAACGA
jgi:uncharacterized protein (DUF433 family)